MPMKILVVDACVRPQSRTRALTRYLLSKLEGEVTTLELQYEELPRLDGAGLALRDSLLAAGDLEHPMFRYARQFARADLIIIAAPYWDLSFPALLKQYLEAVTVTGITFRYTEDGLALGLCKAERLIYITTAGGPIINDHYGFGYLRGLSDSFYNIPWVDCVKAEGLDMVGADTEAILARVRANIDHWVG